ncbi:hypothetical protein JFT37_27275 [Pseudomonas fluorescens]|nr:hypothetical protein [Pseudomonas fluorescens]
MTPVKYEPKQHATYEQMLDLHRQLSRGQVFVSGDIANNIKHLFCQAFTDFEIIVNCGTTGIRAARSTARLRYESVHAQIRYGGIVVSDLTGEACQ